MLKNQQSDKIGPWYAYYRSTWGWGGGCYSPDFIPSALLWFNVSLVQNPFTRTAWPWQESSSSWQHRVRMLMPLLQWSFAWSSYGLGTLGKFSGGVICHSSRDTSERKREYFICFMILKRTPGNIWNLHVDVVFMFKGICLREILLYFFVGQVKADVCIRVCGGCLEVHGLSLIGQFKPKERDFDKHHESLTQRGTQGKVLCGSGDRLLAGHSSF